MKRIESWLNTALDELSNPENEEAAKKVFSSCGADCAKKCGMNALVEKTRKEIKDIDEFEERLRIIGHNFQGSFRAADDGFYVEYGPWDCDCELVREYHIQSSVFCNCTAGFHESVWSGVFEKKVKVEILETVLRGANVCRLKVMFDGGPET